MPPPRVAIENVVFVQSSSINKIKMSASRLFVGGVAWLLVRLIYSMFYNAQSTEPTLNHIYGTVISIVIVFLHVSNDHSDSINLKSSSFSLIVNNLQPSVLFVERISTLTWVTLVLQSSVLDSITWCMPFVDVTIVVVAVSVVISIPFLFPVSIALQVLFYYSFWNLNIISNWNIGI